MLRHPLTPYSTKNYYKTNVMLINPQNCQPIDMIISFVIPARAGMILTLNGEAT